MGLIEDYFCQVSGEDQLIVPEQEVILYPESVAVFEIGDLRVVFQSLETVLFDK